MRTSIDTIVGLALGDALAHPVAELQPDDRLAAVTVAGRLAFARNPEAAQARVGTPSWVTQTAVHALEVYAEAPRAWPHAALAVWRERRLNGADGSSRIPGRLRQPSFEFLLPTALAFGAVLRHPMDAMRAVEAMVRVASASADATLLRNVVEWINATVVGAGAEAARNQLVMQVARRTHAARPRALDEAGGVDSLVDVLGIGRSGKHVELRLIDALVSERPVVTTALVAAFAAARGESLPGSLHTKLSGRIGALDDGSLVGRLESVLARLGG